MIAVILPAAVIHRSSLAYNNKITKNVNVDKTLTISLNLSIV